MGTCSYVLTGTQTGMENTFGTTCHGAVSVCKSVVVAELLVNFRFRVEHCQELNQGEIWIIKKFLTVSQIWEYRLELLHPSW